MPWLDVIYLELNTRRMAALAPIPIKGECLVSKREPFLGLVERVSAIARALAVVLDYVLWR